MNLTPGAASAIRADIDLGLARGVPRMKDGT